MKRLAIVIGIISGLVLMAACTRPSQVPELVEGPPPKLVAVDSLMWRQPDSALALLLPWFDSVAVPVEYDLHYAHLLLSELLYKNYYEQTNRAELLQSEAYFDSISLIINDSPHILWSHCGPSFRECGTQSPQTKDNIAFLAARAHYMDGVGHYERDSLVPACREYMKALEIMEDRFEEKELTGHRALFMAYVYTRLTEIFSSLYLHEQAIYYGKKSLLYYGKQLSSSRKIANMLDEIGSHYVMMEELDSADCYFKKAVNLLQDTNNLTYRDLSSHITYLSYENGKDPFTSLGKMKSLLALAENQKEYLSRCLTIGEIYYHERIFDSAFFYLNRVFQESNSIASKKQAAEWLIGIRKEENKEDGVNVYTDFLVPFANQEENKSYIKSELTELYKRCIEKQLERQHQETIRMKTKRTIAFVVCAFLVLSSIYALLYYMDKKRKKHLEAQIKEDNTFHEMQQKSLSGRLKKSNETLREALKLIEEQKLDLEKNKIRTNNKNNGFDVYQLFLQTPICQEVLDKVRQLRSDPRKTLKTDTVVAEFKPFSLTKTQLALLSKAVDEHYPRLFDSLKTLYPSFNKRDWEHCILYLLQLDKMTICVLLLESYDTGRRYSLKLEKKLSNNQDLTVFLLNMIGVSL